MEHARFLLHVELDGKAVTCNPYFEQVLVQTRSEGVQKRLKSLAVWLLPTNSHGSTPGNYVRLDQITADTTETTRVETICGAIHDVTKATTTSLAAASSATSAFRWSTTSS